MWVTPNIKRACVKKFAHAAFADGSAIHSDGYRSYIPGLEGYRAVTLGHSRLLFCVHRDHPLANEQVETLTQVGNTPLIMLFDSNSQTKYLKRLFRAAD